MRGIVRETVREPRRLSVLASILAAGLLLAGSPRGAAAATQVVYDNALRNGWQDWSWAAHNLAQSAIYQSAPNAISWEPDAVDGDWQGIYFHSNNGAADPSVADFSAVRFWIHGAGGAQAVRLAIYQNNVEIGSKNLTPLPSAWTRITLTWTELGVTATGFDGIVFQTNAPADQATAYLDDLELVEATGGPPPGGAVTVTVDPTLDRRAINPLIYGVNWADAQQLATGLYTANRRGGNATTRYNWLLDTSNRAFDYFFLNIHEGGSKGAAADSFVASTLAAGAEAVMTVPIDQVAKSTSRTPGFSTTKYGPQTATECINDPFCANNGNGECNPSVNFTMCGAVRCCSPAGLITGNSPADTSIPVDLDAHVGDFVSHLVTSFGSANGGGVHFYNLDNEPMLWNSTHRDVHPAPATYDEVWTKGSPRPRRSRAATPAPRSSGPRPGAGATSGPRPRTPPETASPGPTAPPTATCRGPRGTCSSPAPTGSPRATRPRETCPSTGWTSTSTRRAT